MDRSEIPSTHRAARAQQPPPWPTSRLESARWSWRAAWVSGLATTGDALVSAWRAAGFQSDADPNAWAFARAEQLAWPVRPLRVALAGQEAWPESEARAFADHAPLAGPIEWLCVTPDVVSDDALTRRDLDAVVRRVGVRGYEIITRECPGHEAAWTDWSREMPLCYASAFPSRVDAARVRVAIEDHADAELRVKASSWCAALAECAGHLSRTWPRLSVASRLAGRAPLASILAQGEREASARSIEQLGERLLSTHALGAIPVPALRLASAWSVSDSCSWSPDLRHAVAEAAANALADSPSLLRLGASAMAAGRTDDALAAFIKADALHPSRARGAIGDTLVFVLSELRFGPATRLSFARAAAGLAMASLTLDDDRVRFLRDDTLDELDESGLLQGRGPDRASLCMVFDEILRARANRSQDRLAA